MAARAGLSHEAYTRTPGRAGSWTPAAGLAALPTAALVGALVVLAAGLRFMQLSSWPVFFDEDSYVETAMVVARMPWAEGMFTASVRSFKPPLQPMIHATIVWLGADSLVTGRAMMATAGLVTTALTFLLGRRLGGRSVGLVAAALYALSPMAVLHERTINLDAWLTTFALAATLASLAAVEHRSSRAALVAALCGALAVQVKTPGIVVAAVPVLALLVGPKSTPPARLQAIIALAGPLVSYLALMKSPIGVILSAQNAMLIEPFGALWQNTTDVADSLWTYFPAGLALLLLVGLALALRESPRLALTLATMIVIWIAPWVALGWFAPSRYYLAALPILCAFCALALVRIPVVAPSGPIRLGAMIVAAVLVAISGVTAARIAFDHAQAPLSSLDDWQYRSGWPAGYGLSDAAALVRRAAEPGSSVAYLIDQHHVVGAGLYADLPSGVTSLGRLDVAAALPTVDGRLYLVVDDALDRPWRFPDGRERKDVLATVLADRPDLEVVAQFPRPGSSLTVTVLRSR